MRTHSLIALSLLVLFPSVGLAQSNNYQADCSDLDGVNEPQNWELGSAACGKSRINLQSLINHSTAINSIVTGRLRPDQITPAGLSLSSADDVNERAANDQTVQIIPSADVSTPVDSPSWNLWKDAKYSWIDDTADYSNLDGALVNLVTGMDYKFSERLVIGIMGTYETSDREGDGVLPPTIETSGWGVGAYMGYNLTNELVFSANVVGARIDTDVNDGSVEFESDRVQAAAALTGYYYSGTWRFSPAVNLAWSKEWQEDKANVFDDQTYSSAIVSPGFQVGNTVALSDTVTVEPWAGAQIDWAFLNQVEQEGFGVILDDPYVDLRLSAGLNFALGTKAQLALTAEANGLLLDDSDTYTGGVNFAYQF